MDDPGVHRGVGHVELPVVGAIVAEPAPDPIERADDLGRVLDGVDAPRRQGRVALEPAYAASNAELSLVGADHPHFGGFANDAAKRTGPALDELVQQPAHADAADLLVVGEGEVNRSRELAGKDFGRHREHDGDEALHVARPAPVKPAVPFDDREGIARPLLTVDRHDVGVPGKNQPTLAFRPQRGEQIRLAAALVEYQFGCDAEPGQIVAHPMNQRQIRIPAGGVERNKPADDVERCRTRRSHG